MNIETATTVCSVALSENGKALALKEVNNGYTHSENLTVFIEDLFSQTGCKPSELEAVAVSKGPGSYTGLRIGVSTAKGLCYGLGIPLISVSTLQAMAYRFINAPDRNLNFQNSILCPMLDARRMEVYCALYDVQLNEVGPVQAKIIDAHSFEEQLRDKTIYFFGDGAAKCTQILNVHSTAVFSEGGDPSATALISFAEEAFKAGRFESVAYFEPYYLKDFIAGPKKVS